MPQVKATPPDCSQEKGFSLFPTKNWCGLYTDWRWNFRTWLRDFLSQRTRHRKSTSPKQGNQHGALGNKWHRGRVKLLLIMQLAGRNLQLTGILLSFRANNEGELKLPSFVVVWDKVWFCALSQKEQAETYWLKENSDMSWVFWKDLARNRGTQERLT